jgi:hypothetical protein
VWADECERGFLAAGLISGHLKKTERRRKLVQVRQVMRCSARVALRSAVQALRLSGRLTSAFVERLTLRLRQSVAALIGRSWSSMQDMPDLLLDLECWRAYYHLVRPHESLLLALAQPIWRAGKPRRQRQKAASGGHGGRAEAPALCGAESLDGATGASAAWYWLMRGENRGRRALPSSRLRPQQAE